MGSQEIEFLEDYVLAVDRLAVVDGIYDDDTLDYWYWSVLNAQVKGDREELDTWLENADKTEFKNTEKMQELFFRQALIDYAPEMAENVSTRLEEICQNVNLDHEQDRSLVDVQKEQYPTQIQLSTIQLLRDQFEVVMNGEANISDLFTPRAAEFLAKQQLDDSELIGDFLELIAGESPDISRLLDIVQADLEQGTIFGQRDIHKKLTKRHMIHLAERMPGAEKQPGILGDESFLVAFCKKLRPITDKNLKKDVELLGTYLEELKDFAMGQIGDNHASLKGLILFNYIAYQESQGEEYDKRVVKAYMLVPKYQNVFKPHASVLDANPAISCDVNWSCDELPELEPILDDEALIRRALSDFFLAGDKTDSWSPFTDKVLYALPLWAEAQLLEGRGNEQFQKAQMKTVEDSEIVPGAMKRLTQRVELEFTKRNKTLFTVEDSVELTFVTKNNPTIEVSVYAVNAKNYYKQMLNEIPLDLNLSGSSPISAFSMQLDNPPLRKNIHSLPLPDLNGQRGVFLVVLIGNGLTTRAIIRKGELRFIADQEKENATGYVFKIFNEKSEMIQRPRIWMAGDHYEGNEEGDVHIPFATTDTNEMELIILEDLDNSGSATLQQFRRESPNYRMECGMYIDREQLKKKQEAHVLIRCNLYMNNEIISVKNLDNIQFKLTMEDNQNSVRTRIEEIDLNDESETVFAFIVPTELRSIECVLSCNIRGKLLMAKQSLGLNTTDDTMDIANMFMHPSGNAGYVLSVLGKNGEGYGGVPVKLTFHHRFFKEHVECMVQTDENGQIYLGRLPDVDLVEAVCDEDFVAGEASFEVLTNFVTVPTVIHRATGTSARLPFTPSKEDKQPKIFLYDNCYIQSFSNLANYADGYITIDGLPSGDFTLYIRDYQSLEITVRISEGVQVTNELGEYVLSTSRVLQLSEDWPLQIVETTGDRAEGYTIRLQGYNERTRVHIVCLSQNPVFNIYGFLASPFCPPDVIEFNSPSSTYVKAQPLAEEYQYIVNRKHAAKLVGNMLQRPSMLSTAFTSQEIPLRSMDPQKKKKRAFEDGHMGGLQPKQLLDLGKAQKRREADPAAIEFLGEASFVYANRVVDEDGVVHLSADLINPQHNILQILAVDDDNTCLKNIILPRDNEEEPTPQTDVRLVESLDVGKHFTEVRRIICLPNKSDAYVIEDFSTAEYEPYETIEEPFNLYRSRAGNQSDEFKFEFINFEPLVKWHTLFLREKLNFYDEFSCNEVNYFLFRKDREFFDTVVAPALVNKSQKTFFDLYLLGADLLEYTTVNKYHQLNALEQILLADNLGNDEWTYKTLRNFDEKAELEAIDPREQDMVFNLAIKSAQLGVDELDRAMMQLEGEMAEAQLAQQRRSMGQSDGVDEEKTTDIWGSEEYINLTLEYQETGYWKMPMTSQGANLITHTRYWRDYAHFVLDPEAKTDGFLSEWFMTACSNLNEMLCSMAVLDVPLEADEPKRVPSAGNEVRVLAKDPVILFVRELVETAVRTSAISVSTNYFDPFERTHVIDGEQIDQFIIGDFATNKVYGSRIVVTNVSSVEQRVEILCQIPQGSIPCGQECFQTQSWSQVIEPFGTYKREYFFYWPEAGGFNHYPVMVNKNGDCIGHGKDAVELNVETRVVPTDVESWRYISNLGEEEQILEFLANNAEALSVDLSKICWRFPDNPDFFDAVCEILRNRQIYNDEIWAYSLLCDGGRGTRELGEFLSQNDEFLDYVGPSLVCPLLTSDQKAVRAYQVHEFWPLLNPRAHDIFFSSADFREYYANFLYMIAFKTATVNDMDLEDQMCLVNYLLLRNHVDKAKDLFSLIDPEIATVDCRMVYDYMKVYLQFHEGDPEDLAAVAEQYASMSLPDSEKCKWQAIIDQIAHGQNPALSDAMFLKKQEAQRLKAQQPSLDFFPQDDHTIQIITANNDEITVNFYITELELMFSMYPFQDENVSYKLMMPNMSETINLQDGDELVSGEIVIRLPDVLQGQNTIVEMIAGDLVVCKVNYDNEIDVQVSTDVGELRVLNSRTGRPIERAYCKVHAQNIRDGSSEFYKDGYTDIRGRFDYRFLSTDQLRSSKRLSVLVSTPQNGSLIREIKVPKSFLTRTSLF